MFTPKELQVLMPLIDAGVRSTGLQVFQDSGGIVLQSVLGKLQDMSNAHAKPKADGDSERSPQPEDR